MSDHRENTHQYSDRKAVNTPGDGRGQRTTATKDTPTWATRSERVFVTVFFSAILLAVFFIFLATPYNLVRVAAMGGGFFTSASPKLPTYSDPCSDYDGIKDWYKDKIKWDSTDDDKKIEAIRVTRCKLHIWQEQERAADIRIRFLTFFSILLSSLVAAGMSFFSTNYSKVMIAWLSALMTALAVGYKPQQTYDRYHEAFVELDNEFDRYTTGLSDPGVTAASLLKKALELDYKINLKTGDARNR